MSSDIHSTFSPTHTEWSDSICWDPMEYEEDLDDYGNELDLSVMRDIGRATLELLPEDFRAESFPDTKVVFGEEVGDDRLDASRNPLILATGLAVQEQVFHMKTSKEDTFISKEIWNFCEISNSIPTDVTQSYNHCRKSNEFNKLGFTDVPPLRIILDTKKGDRSHSSTVPGKATMLGNRMRTPNPKHLASLQLASYMQDGMLRTSMSTEPKYLPQIMGGSGCRTLFSNVSNLYTSVHAYRGGSCQRVYGTATRELQDCLYSLERGKATMPVLCTKLRDKQEYLHGTYANKVMIPSSELKDSSKETTLRPIYLAGGGANVIQCFENRLIRTRHLITRSQAERQHEYYTRVRDQIASPIGIGITDSTHRLKKAREREKYGRALSANTAFSNLLNRNATEKDVTDLLLQGFLPVNTGVTRFSLMDATFLFNGGKSENFSIDDLTSSEDLFIREEVSDEETYKVPNITLQPILSGMKRQVATTTKIGLYQINESQQEWGDKIIRQFQEARIEGNPLPRDVTLRILEKNPEWINDDSLLIERSRRDTKDVHQTSGRVILVSSDKRLANQMANSNNIHVIRLEPLDFLIWKAREGSSMMTESQQLEKLSAHLTGGGRTEPYRGLYIDTGSVAAASTKLVETDGKRDVVFYKRHLISTGHDIHHNRYSKYTLQEIKGKLQMRRAIHRPMHRQRGHKFVNSSTDSSRW